LILRENKGAGCGSRGGSKIAALWAFGDGSWFVPWNLRSDGKDTVRGCVKSMAINM
jgi:hypothetical protein